jgi:putative DNA primase/helicase
MDAQGIGTMLLADIREVFTKNKCDRIFSKSLVEQLCEMTDQPWSEARRGKPVTENWIARRLRSFGVSSQNIRIGDEQAKGYELADFGEVFDRYIPKTEDTGVSKRPTVPNLNFS